MDNLRTQSPFWNTSRSEVHRLSQFKESLEDLHRIVDSIPDFQNESKFRTFFGHNGSIKSIEMQITPCKNSPIKNSLDFSTKFISALKVELGEEKYFRLFEPNREEGNGETFYCPIEGTYYMDMDPKELLKPIFSVQSTKAKPPPKPPLPFEVHENL